MQRFHLSHVMRFAAALLITATMVTACGGEGQPPAKAATTVPPAVPVELLVLEEQPIQRANEYVAAIRSLSSTTVQPQAEGFLTRVGGLVARQRPVTLGPIVDGAYPVLSGLSEGDQLVLAGTQKIGDGAPVQTLPTGPSPGAPVGPPGDLPPDGAASPPGAR